MPPLTLDRRRPHAVRSRVGPFLTMAMNRSDVPDSIARRMAISISNPAIRECGVSVAGATLYKLSEPLTVVMQVGMGELRITVPAGFVTDLATVPRVLWPLIAPSGPHQRAAIIHDYLYQCAGDVSRFLADAIFRDLMAYLNVPMWRRVSAYYAVRVFGGRHWTE